MKQREKKFVYTYSKKKVDYVRKDNWSFIMKGDASLDEFSQPVTFINENSVEYQQSLCQNGFNNKKLSPTSCLQKSPISRKKKPCKRKKKAIANVETTNNDSNLSTFLSVLNHKLVIENNSKQKYIHECKEVDNRNEFTREKLPPAPCLPKSSRYALRKNKHCRRKTKDTEEKTHANIETTSNDTNFNTFVNVLNHESVPENNSKQKNIQYNVELTKKKYGNLSRNHNNNCTAFKNSSPVHSFVSIRKKGKPKYVCEENSIDDNFSLVSLQDKTVVETMKNKKSPMCGTGNKLCVQNIRNKQCRNKQKAIYSKVNKPVRNSLTSNSISLEMPISFSIKQVNSNPNRDITINGEFMPFSPRSILKYSQNNIHKCINCSTRETGSINTMDTSQYAIIKSNANKCNDNVDKIGISVLNFNDSILAPEYYTPYVERLNFRMTDRIIDVSECDRENLKFVTTRRSHFITRKTGFNTKGNMEDSLTCYDMNVMNSNTKLANFNRSKQLQQSVLNDITNQRKPKSRKSNKVNHKITTIDSVRNANISETNYQIHPVEQSVINKYQNNDAFNKYVYDLTLDCTSSSFFGCKDNTQIIISQGITASNVNIPNNDSQNCEAMRHMNEKRTSTFKDVANQIKIKGHIPEISGVIWRNDDHISTKKYCANASNHLKSSFICVNKISDHRNEHVRDVVNSPNSFTFCTESTKAISSIIENIKHISDLNSFINAQVKCSTPVSGSNDVQVMFHRGANLGLSSIKPIGPRVRHFQPLSPLNHNFNSLNVPSPCHMLDFGNFINQMDFSPEKLSMTAAEILDLKNILSLCESRRIISFSEVYSWRKLVCRKVGEGSYGEVFSIKRGKERLKVLKIIPIETADSHNFGRNKIHQSVSFKGVMREFTICRLMSELRNGESNKCHNFIELNKISCVEGKFPQPLLKAWKNFKKLHKSLALSEDPNKYSSDQLFVIFELEFGGCELEQYKVKNSSEALSIFRQISAALAIGEAAYEFEHRDLHLSNILISPTSLIDIEYCMNGKKFKVPSHGVLVKIIDFTLSRLTDEKGSIIFTNVDDDASLLKQSGNEQVNVYQQMHSSLRGNWEKFCPYTNILWLRYLIKILSSLDFMKSAMKNDSNLLTLKKIKREINRYSNVEKYVLKKYL